MKLDDDVEKAVVNQAREEKRRTVEAVFALAGGACYDRACFVEPSQGASAVTAFLGGRQASLEAPARGPMSVDLADKDEVNSLDVPGWSAEEIWSMMSNWLGGTP